MTIITISGGLYSNGNEVAGKVAERLGYSALSREAIFEAAKKYRISENKLEEAMHDAPSLFQRFSPEKQKYIDYVAAEVLAAFAKDNVVYSGYSGHFFASNIPHMPVEVLAYLKNDNVNYNGFAGRFFESHVTHLFNVRIVANLEDRIHLLMNRQNLSREQAASLLKKDDHERQAWSRHFYGMDSTDLSLYDLAIHINKLTVADAVDAICERAVQPKFSASPDSQLAIENMALAAGIRAALIGDYPRCEVIADGQAVEIFVRYTLHTDAMIVDKITEKVLNMPGVSKVSVILIPSVVFT
ncbi:MAG: cytidylate kinase-like family protein [Desulfocapsaceae bacterium]|nr:cytidylate kinase-like family protein [Desulfocapsaceae bacterium]